MEGPKGKSSFVPRAALNRVITYRAHLRWTYWGIMALGLFYFAALAGFFLLKADWVEELFSIELVWGASLLWLFLLLINHFLYRPIAFSVVTVSPNQLEIEKKGRTIQVPYANVEKAEFFLPPFFGGAFTLQMKDKSSHSFTLNLERSEYILETLYSFNPQLVPKDKITLYRRRLIVADHSNARSFERMKKWKHLLVKYFLLPLSVTAARNFSGLSEKIHLDSNSFWSHLIGDFALVFALNGVLGIGIYLVADFVLRMKDRKMFIDQPNLTRRDLLRDAQFSKIGSFIYLILASLGALLLVYKF